MFLLDKFFRGWFSAIGSGRIGWILYILGDWLIPNAFGLIITETIVDGKREVGIGLLVIGCFLAFAIYAFK